MGNRLRRQGDFQKLELPHEFIAMMLAQDERV